MAGIAVARVGVALLSSDIRRLVVATVAALFLGFVAIVFFIVMLLKSLLGFAGGSASLALLPGAGGAAGPLASSIPADQLAFMQQVAAASSCGVPWSVLAGVASVESSFGTNLGPSSAGAYGYGQFEPGTWAAYAPGGVPLRTTDPAQLALPSSQRLDSSNFHYALPAMARYLCAMVAEFGVRMTPQEALKHALFYYNHALGVPYDANDAYVSSVLGFALRVGTGIGGTVPGQVGGHPWTIAFGFKQPYGAAQFSSDVPIHRGIDLIITGAPNNGRGQRYLAFYPGVVAALTHDPFGGLGIIIWDARNRLYHRYFHSDAVLVSVGQHVDTTTPVGVLGATGTEGFPHLHYEVARNINGDPVCCLVDPQPFLRGEVPST
ncbi:MAG TPA: peptidoglycan DD-metalloendopeptidase family protein [Chloroflexota bacterium]